MNNILSSEYMPTVKEEFKEDDFVDDKVSVSETIIADNSELSDDISHNIVKQDEMLTSLDNIKIEQAENNPTNDDVKIEEGTNVHEIKTEFENSLLFCEHCHVYYDGYCMECGMLLHILNKNTLDKADNVTQDGLPNDILKIGDSLGIFALRVIPKNVKFGPFTELSTSKNKWKLKGGKFIVSEDKLKYLNWMRHINSAMSICEQNLLPLQYAGNLYYQSTRQIHEGEELLVYFGEEYEESLNKNVEMNFIPVADQDIKDVFACTFCCLGFSSRSYLTKHYIICRNNAGGKSSTEELTQCPFCNFYLGEQEYYEYHMTYCSKRNARKSILRKPDNRPNEVKTDRTSRLQMYKCAHCKYKTSYKGDLKSHAIQHYEVRQYKCGICCTRFKTRKYLKIHLENIHIHVNGKLTQKYIQSEGSKHKRTKRTRRVNHPKQLYYNCEICDYKTNNRSYLRMHIKTKHLKEFDYNCGTCDYKTNVVSNLETHIKVKHLKEFDYNCELCDYKTNDRTNLELHIKAKHLKEFEYNCEMCNYKTNNRSYLGMHIKTKHLKQFDHNCDMCDFKTNHKSYFIKHTKTKHFKEFDYNCGTCDYKTNNKVTLEFHLKVKHLKEYNYSCEMCDYKTNYRSYLRIHIKTKHFKEFEYNCDNCAYKTNDRTRLEMHIKTKHLKEFDYKCELCDYKTNERSNLESHRKAIHLKEFNYNCEMCDFKTIVRSNLNRHIKAKHLKEFDYNCEMCDFKTNRKSHLKKHTKTKHLKT